MWSRPNLSTTRSKFVGYNDMMQRRSHLDKWQCDFVEVSTQQLPCEMNSPMHFRTIFDQHAAVFASLRAEGVRMIRNGSEDLPRGYKRPNKHGSFTLPSDQAMQSVTLRF